ncbi:MAG TPA: type II toxin-antitoxin system prevent-host-death family antitoxin [Caulobacteraceae bacterium]|jgi:prevent-host-death family protein
MKQVSLYEAKTHLSALTDEAAAGEEIVISKNGKPRARLVALGAKGAARHAPRFGFWSHYGWKLPDNFDDPDPEIEALFNDGPVFPGGGA